MRILQFGTTGQLARALLRETVARPDISLIALSRSDADFNQLGHVAEAVHSAKDADVVVNAVAYTAVERAETDEDVAQRVNAESVGTLARACAMRNIPLIHVSTDYVFDGRKTGAYVETDPPYPLSAYGRSKLAGEEAIRQAGGYHAILRTSWVYSAGGTNFLTTMLRLGKERDELRIVDDQHGAPTAADDLARVIITMAERLAYEPDTRHCGTFLYCNDGETTWRLFAETIFEEAGPDMNIRARIIPIPAVDYPLSAQRPMNSRLDCRKIETVYGLERPHWRTSLARIMTEMKALRGRDA